MKGLYVDQIHSIDHQALADVVAKERRLFSASTVYQHARSRLNLKHRNSLSLRDLSVIKNYRDLVSAEVSQRWPAILEALDVRCFSIVRSDVTCLAYGNGNFFARHQDVIQSHLFPRRITWIYYFYKEPAAFQGGEIVFYRGKENTARISPSSGMLVAFDSSLQHEATTVSLTSDQFADYRFALVCFVVGLPTLRSCILSSKIRLETRFPFTRAVTQPVVRQLKKFWSFS